MEANMERIKNLYKRVESTLENYLVITLLITILVFTILIIETVNTYINPASPNIMGFVLSIILLYMVMKLYKAIIIKIRRERKMQEIRESMQKRKNERQKKNNKTAEIIPFPNKLVRIILRVKQYVV